MSGRAMPDPSDLDGLLAVVQETPGLDRDQFLDLVAAHGEAAVGAVEPWLVGSNLQSFAVRVLEVAGARDEGARIAALAALRDAMGSASLMDAERYKSAVRALERKGVAASRSGPILVGTDPRSPGYTPPLSAPEKELLDRLMDGLPDGWRVYVRPHLDGDRPALALLHPVHGAMLWHIKPGSWRNVIGERQHYRTRDGQAVVDPVGYINTLRQRLYTDYLPAWAEAIDDDTRMFGVARAGVYLPDAADEDISRLGMAGLHEVVVNREQLGRQAVGQLLPNLNKDVEMGVGWFEVLDARFSEYHPPTMSSIQLTKVQRDRVMDPVEPSWRGIEGVAGAGKSTVLARRAASLARQGGRVLLVTYNQTLANYCRALAEAAPDRYLRENLVVQHFHGLCHVVHREAEAIVPLHPNGQRDGHESPQPCVNRAPTEAERDHYERIWPESTLGALTSLRAKAPDAFHFQSILVDEAQDFSPVFLNVLQEMRAPGGEVVLAFDWAQRLYARDDGVRQFLDMRRIRGLGGTRRLRQRHADIASALGVRQRLPTQRIELDEGMTPLFSDEDAQWVAVGDEQAAAAAACAVVERWQQRDGYRTDGTVILVPSARLGRVVVEVLAHRDIKTNHIFPDPRERTSMQERSRRRKASFVPNDQRVKVATIHSYKGWEADDVLVLEPHSAGDASAAILYVALTRPKSRLVVIASSDGFGLRTMFDEMLVEPDEAIIAAARDAYRPAPKGGGTTARLDDGLDPAPPPEEWRFD